VQREAIRATYLNSIYELESVGGSQLSTSGMSQSCGARRVVCTQCDARGNGNTGSAETIASIEVNHTGKKCSFISFFPFVSRYLFQQYRSVENVIITEISYGLVSCGIVRFPVIFFSNASKSAVEPTKSPVH
jgi:hypothetical protein